ncbi:MAG TPA: SLAP domain-containing protein [Pseudogracilibacillus sp.]|nr:SLAP domain-containing protein [Pseudogracilibacillus sp.]
MQTLYFESAWDKTISKQDRNDIIEIFKQTDFTLGDTVQFTFLWGAYNYKEELLVTALTHNCGNTPLYINDSVISFVRNNEIIATGKFQLHTAIKSKTTMPWTFIFSPTNSTNEQPEYIIEC